MEEEEEEQEEEEEEEEEQEEEEEEEEDESPWEYSGPAHALKQWKIGPPASKRNKHSVLFVYCLLQSAVPCCVMTRAQGKTGGDEARGST